MDIMLMNEVLNDVWNERERQYQLWGDQEHLSWVHWLAILGEEFGEVCEALGALHALESVKETDSTDLYEELIHLAAVAVKMAEKVKIEGWQNESS